MDKNENGQRRLEEHAGMTEREYGDPAFDETYVAELKINSMMKPKVYACSYDERTLTFEFELQQWQLNRAGHLHGGMICTAFDITLAALARFYAKENYAPTISLDVKFVRPVTAGDSLLVTAKAVALGRRITQLTCEGHSKRTGKLIATGASVYMNTDTAKEHRNGENVKKTE